MKRPAGFTLLALLFAWLTIAGFAYAIAAQTAKPDQLAAWHLRPAILTLMGLAYGTSAAAVTLGLWRAAPWTSNAIVVWGVSLLLNIAALQAMIGVAGEPWWMVSVPYLLFLVLVGTLSRYARKRTLIADRAI